jgi:predicted MFS family arabinose efflux permease
VEDHPVAPRRGAAAGVVSLSFYAQLTTAGLASYGIGVFLKPIAEEFGTTRLAVSLGPTLYTLASSAISPFVGRLVDRVGSRPVMLAGALWLGIGLAAIAAVTAFWQLGVLLVAGVAVGSTLAGSLPSNALIARYFAAAPGRALGIAATGSSVGGMLVPPLAAALLLATGWRSAVAGLGLIPLLTLAPLVWLLAPRDRDRAELAPDPGGARASTGGRAALRERSFWLLAICIGLIYSTNTALLVHLIPFATDIGFDAQRAALLVSLVAAGSFSGKLLYSAFGHRFEIRAPLYLAAGVQVAAMALLLTPAPAFGTLAAIALCNGVGTGAVLPAWSALIARCFGTAHFGEVLGWMRPFTYPVMNMGLLLAAYVKDTSGSYSIAWQAFAAMALTAGLLPLWMRISPPTKDEGIER